MANVEPLVTVLIPAFNAAGTIARALRSVIAQDYPALEIIVVDDASHDATATVAAGIGDERIRVLVLPQNLGVSGATNAGIAATRGEFVALLDADDEWRPGKLRKQLAAISGRPDMSFVNCGCIVMGQAGETKRIDDIVPPPFPETEYWRAYLAASHVWKSTILIRRSVLTTVGPFDESLRVAEDQDMFIRLALAGPVGHVPEPLAVTHDTAGSLTKRYAASQAEFLLPMIRKHLTAQAHRLSAPERRRILGQRHAEVGRHLYGAGNWRQGLRHLATASFLGYQPLQNAWYLSAASMPAQWMKHLLRR